jgi:hypothetical protein
MNLPVNTRFTRASFGCRHSEAENTIDAGVYNMACERGGALPELAGGRRSSVAGRRSWFGAELFGLILDYFEFH